MYVTLNIEPGPFNSNVSTYLKKIESELRAQSRLFKSEAGLEFPKNRQMSSLDSGTKQCTQWLFEFAQNPQPNKPLEPAP